MSGHDTPVALVRDCRATTVPYGEQVTLCEGGEVRIVQQLGSSITVRTPMGALLRIDGSDADALGINPVEALRPVPEGSFDMGMVADALDGVYDPEIPVSIVELGLVYRCEELPTAHGGRRIEIDMTMTAPGCGMGEVLRADAEAAVQAVPGVDEVLVTLVWQPPWSMEQMSDAARLQLGLL